MINRTLLAGRVTRAPWLSPEAGCCCLELDISHPRPLNHAGQLQPAAVVRIEVLIPDRRQAHTLRRWIKTGSYLLVAGYLAPPAAGLTRVELERWEFLPDELNPVDFLEEVKNEEISAEAA